MIQARPEGRVLCVGRLYCDLIFTGLTGLPQSGKEQFAAGLSLHAGGGAYITAAYLDSLKRTTSLLASLPSEPFLTAVLSDIDATGVDASLCQVPTVACDPQLTVAMSLQEDRAFLTRRAGPALPPGALPRDYWPDLVHLHVGELRTLIEHPELIVWARDLDLSISLDPSWDDDALNSAESLSIIDQVDVFLPNQAEFDALTHTGFSVTDTLVCVVKQGSSGASIVSSASSDNIAAEPVDVVDATGAGDAFNAGFLNAWISGRVIVDCVQAGNACGARAVGRLGGKLDTHA